MGFTSPFFWAFVSMLGLLCATSIFSAHPLARSRVFVATAILLFTLGRVVLVLPCCPQPRFRASGWHLIVGGALVASALVPGLLALRVKWWAPPGADTQLVTTGVYGIVRHPIYLSEVFWFLGWSILFRSSWGLGLTLVFWLALLVHALSEEAALERELGDEYRRYASRVRGRFLPGLPV